MKNLCKFLSLILFVFIFFSGFAFADVEEPSLLMKTADFISNPFIGALILAIGLTGLLKEMMIEEKKYVGGAVACVSLGFFFGVKYLANQLDFIGLGLIILGIILVIVEIFFIPGLGAPGIIGTIMIFIGILRFCDNNFQDALILGCLVFIFVFAFTFAITKYLGMTFRFKDGAIHSQPASSQEINMEQEPLPDLSIGLKGVTTTFLRPAGKVKFDLFGQEVISDAVAEKNSFIEKDKNVEIIEISNNRVVVKEIIMEDK